MSKNIYDAYLYKYKKFILIISYTPGINIDFLIDDISKTFNLKKIKLFEMNYDETNNKVNKYLEENEFNINNSLEHYYGIGLLIYGHTFPIDNLKFRPDLQLHISSSLKMFLNFDKKNTKEMYDNLTNSLVNNKINKYYNIKHPINIEFNDKIYDKIIDFIMYKVYDKETYMLYSKKSDKLNISNIVPDNNLESSDLIELENLDDSDSDSVSSNLSNLSELSNLLASSDIIESEIYNLRTKNNLLSENKYSKLSTLYTNLFNLNNISNKEMNELLQYIKN
jgi:hypothetical protein